MNKRKTIIIVLLLIVVCLVVLKIIFGEKNQNKDSRFLMQKDSNTQSSNEAPTTVINQNDKIKLPKIDNEQLYVLDYKWNLNQIEIPSKIHVYGVEDKKINNETLNNFVKYFGFYDKPTDNDANVIAYANDAEGTSLYLSKHDLFVNYYLDLIKNPKTPGENRLSEIEIKNKLIELINKLIDLPEGLSVEVTKIERQKVDEVEYGFATDESARVVYLEMQYKINNYPITTNIGAPINARFFDDGTLLKLVVNLPFSTNTKIRLLSAKTIEQIKQLTGDQFKIFSVSGNISGEIYSNNADVVIESVSLNSGYISYVYEAGNPNLQPYIIFKATGKYKDKTVNLLVGVPALQDNLYK